MRSVNYKALVYGETIDTITPHCGLRQGDPLSPYLFIMCIEKLSQIISCRVNSGDWKGIKLAKHCPIISHVLFADDIILFSKATHEQAYIMKESIEVFCKILGQRVNFDKSMVFCSENVNRAVANSLAEIYGSPVTTDLGTYLGVPIIHKRIKKATYSKILDNMKRKLSSWKSRNLSLASRGVLIKSVLSSMPIYTMNTVKLPASVCNEINKINRRFLWSNTDSNRAVHLIKWEKVCKKKAEGGLGIKQAGPMNQALLAKLGWRAKEETGSLWAKIIQNKYPSNMRSPKNASSIWRGIAHGSSILKKGKIMKIGNGKRTYFWKDKWLQSGSLIHYVPDDNLLN